jgi:type VI secretion system protein ImpK
MNRLLQLQFFNESLAGEGFFTRLQQIRRDGRRPDVLRVYYQCLLLGFQGKYAIRGGDLELMRLCDSLKPEVERHVEASDVLSPAGEPPDEPLLRASGKNTFLWIALGMFAVAIAVFVGLRVSLSHQIADLSARVDQIGH